MDASATRTVFYVVHHEGRWRFEVNDEDHGPFCTQTAAIRAAVDAAHSAGEKGGAAQVLVQRANTEFRTEWTYGTTRIQRRADLASGRAGARARRGRLMARDGM